MAMHRAKRGGGVHGSVVSFLFSSQCIASALFVFMYVIFIHLALLYTEELKGLSDSHVSLSEVSLDLSGFLGSGPAKPGRRVHQVKSEELRAALGDLQGLHRKVKFSFPQWAQALRFTFDGAALGSNGQGDSELRHSHAGGNMVTDAVDKVKRGEHLDASADEETASEMGGSQEESDDHSSTVEDGANEGLREEDVVNVEQIVRDLLASQSGGSKAREEDGKQEKPYLEPLPEDTMEGILAETTIFIEERQKSLARLSSFEPIDENPPELEWAELGPAQEDSRATGVWAIGDPSTEAPVDNFQQGDQPMRRRHLLGYPLDTIDLGASPPCAQDMSPLDPFAFMQASIQKAFDSGTGLVPAPATAFECQMTFDGQGQRCIDRDIVTYGPDEELDGLGGEFIA